MLTPTAWWIAVAPVDLRRGMDGLLATVVSELGRDALDGAAYIFRNKSGSRIKIVYGDGTGVWLCQRRLHRGRFVWPRIGDRVCEIDAASFGWLCAGVDWQRLSAKMLAGAQL
jgi:transposase